MRKTTGAVIVLGLMSVCLTPIAFMEPWWNTPPVNHVEPEHISGEVVAKESQTLNPDSCWQLGLRTLSDSQIKWICVSEEEWYKYIPLATYSR